MEERMLWSVEPSWYKTCHCKLCVWLVYGRDHICGWHIYELFHKLCDNNTMSSIYVENTFMVSPLNNTLYVLIFHLKRLQMWNNTLYVLIFHIKKDEFSFQYSISFAPLFKAFIMSKVYYFLPEFGTHTIYIKDLMNAA